MVSQWPNHERCCGDEGGWKIVCSLTLLGTHLWKSPFAPSSTPLFHEWVKCVVCSTSLWRNWMSQRSKHHVLNLWYSQETRAALLPHSHPRALTGGHESMVNSLLWKGQKTASARGIVTVARDGGNVSASEGWPHANATPRRFLCGIRESCWGCSHLYQL